MGRNPETATEAMSFVKRTSLWDELPERAQNLVATAVQEAFTDPKKRQPLRADLTQGEELDFNLIDPLLKRVGVVLDRQYQPDAKRRESVIIKPRLTFKP
ncbi:MAG: hypothetical protein WC686_04485 [Candidatus Shapirobacteria bacterium]|jgi:hypothetical protein